MESLRDMESLVTNASVTINLLPYSNKKEFAKWAKDNWTKFTRDAKCEPCGATGRCYANAYAAVQRNPGWKMYAGFATHSGLHGVAMPHAWAVDPEGQVYDCTKTWAEEAPVHYYGVEVPLLLADRIAGHEIETGTTPTTNDYLADIDWALRQQSPFEDTG